MKKISRDDLCDAIDGLLEIELKAGYDSVEIGLDCRPPYIKKQGIDEDINFEAFNLRKILNEYLRDRDGSCHLEDEIIWLNEWAEEFESYSKALKAKAKKLKKNGAVDYNELS